MSQSSLYLEESLKTPKIEFSIDKGELEISGRSIPENAIDFYKPVMEWLEDLFGSNDSHQFTVKIQLEYFNTSSSKCLVEIFRRLEKMHQKGSKIDVKWFYDEDDEDMQESGSDFRQIIKIPIEMIPVAEEDE